MTALPTLRRKIIKYFSVIIGLYAALGFFLVVCVFLASATTPRLLHVNYDSIAAAHQMKEAWMALDHPGEFRGKKRGEWQAQFDGALKFEESNITESGEGELAARIRRDWQASREKSAFSIDETRAMLASLDALANLNERGMFALADANTSMSRKVLAFSVAYLLVTLVFAFFVADGLASRLSGPLKNIAEALHRRPKLGSRLKLVEPNSLELLILTTELKRLWDRVSETEKLNVTELVQQKSRLEAVLEAVEDALLVLDTNGNVIHCNQFMLELLNLPGASVVGHKWADLPTNHENYLGLRAILAAEMPDSHEIELLWGPNKFQFSARMRKIGGDPDAPIATLFLLHDITERRQRERFRSEFIDMLSHEIKTPLQSLGTATELLMGRQSELPESVRPLAETIHEDVERMKAVASELVQVTQSPSKSLKINLQSVPLQQLIQEWIRPFRIVGKDKNVKVEFCPPTSGTVVARIDPVKFPWVISNLLSNAIRFSPPGGTVEVCLESDDGLVRIEVLDEGPGIAEEDQSRMFDAFYQGHQAVETGKHGMFGIGLTIAKEVVEAHGGTIGYHGRSPHGSAFAIVLPAKG
jgi:two-component system, NtrC family, sensor histidine kinase KinB